MTKLFKDFPEAILNTVNIAEQCEFNLATGLGYTLPEPAVPTGYTTDSYLRRLCSEAVVRRYGAMTPQVEARLDEEFHLIGRHRLAGSCSCIGRASFSPRRSWRRRDCPIPRLHWRRGRRVGGGVPQWRCLWAISSASVMSTPCAGASPWSGSYQRT